MDQLTERLSDAAPPPSAPLPYESIRQKGRRRRRRRLAAKSLLLLAAIALPVGLVRAFPPTSEVAFQPTVQEAVGLFELPAIGETAADAVNGNIPARARLALEKEDVRHYVWADASGVFCMAGVRAEESSANCMSLPGTEMRYSSQAGGWSARIVPDGYTRAALADGREVDIVNNILAYATTPDPPPGGPETSTPAQAEPVLQGPAGELQLLDDVSQISEAMFAVLESAVKTPLETPLGRLRPLTNQLTTVPLPGLDSQSRGVVVDQGPRGSFLLVPASPSEGRLCLVWVSPSQDDGSYSCQTQELTLYWPLLTSITWLSEAGIGWAAAVPDGWKEVVLADGETIPVQQNLIVIDDLTDAPSTALLRHEDGSTVAFAIAAADPVTPDPRGELTESPALDPATYSVLDQPVTDGPRFDLYRADPTQPEADLSAPRLATDQGGTAAFVMPSVAADDGICVVVINDGSVTNDACFGRAQDASEPLADLSVSDEFTVAVVPDGWTRAELPMGSVVDITGNVLIMPTEIIRQGSGFVEGPAGRLPFDLTAVLD